LLTESAPHSDEDLHLLSKQLARQLGGAQMHLAAGIHVSAYYMCPHPTIYVSAYYFIHFLSPHRLPRPHAPRIRQHTSAHASICQHTSAYYFINLPPNRLPHPDAPSSRYICMCPHATTYVRILLCMCPHTTYFIHLPPHRLPRPDAPSCRYIFVLWY
jgi:hypothetical protein